MTKQRRSKNSAKPVSKFKSISEIDFESDEFREAVAKSVREKQTPREELGK